MSEAKVADAYKAPEQPVVEDDVAGDQSAFQLAGDDTVSGDKKDVVDAGNDGQLAVVQGKSKNVDPGQKLKRWSFWMDPANNRYTGSIILSLEEFSSVTYVYFYLCMAACIPIAIAWACVPAPVDACGLAGVTSHEGPIYRVFGFINICFFFDFAPVTYVMPILYTLVPIMYFFNCGLFVFRVRSGVLEGKIRDNGWVTVFIWMMTIETITRFIFATTWSVNPTMGNGTSGGAIDPVTNMQFHAIPYILCMLGIGFGNAARWWHWFYAYKQGESTWGQLAAYTIGGCVLAFHAISLINAACGMEQRGDMFFWSEGCLWDPHDPGVGPVLQAVDWGLISMGALQAMMYCYSVTCKRKGIHYRYIRMMICNFDAVKDKGEHQTGDPIAPMTFFGRFCNCIQRGLAGPFFKYFPIAWRKYSSNGDDRWRLTFIFNPAVWRCLFYFYILVIFVVAFSLTQVAYPDDWIPYRAIFGEDAEMILNYFITRPATYWLPMLWTFVPIIMLMIFCTNVFRMWATHYESKDGPTARSCTIYTVCMMYVFVSVLFFQLTIATNISVDKPASVYVFTIPFILFMLGVVIFEVCTLWYWFRCIWKSLGTHHKIQKVVSLVAAGISLLITLFYLILPINALCGLTDIPKGDDAQLLTDSGAAPVLLGQTADCSFAGACVHSDGCFYNLDDEFLYPLGVAFNILWFVFAVLQPLGESLYFARSAAKGDEGLLFVRLDDDLSANDYKPDAINV
eukprot:gene583-569_t